MPARVAMPSTARVPVRRRGPRVALVTGVLYFALSTAVFLTIDPDAAGAAWWPGAGLTFGVLCTIPRRSWPAVLAAVFAADLAADVVQGAPVTAGLFWAAANVAEPAIAATVLGRWGGLGRRPLASVAAVVRLVAVAFVAGPPLASLLGTLGSHLVLGQPVLPTWPRWLVGDALGIVVVAPVVLQRAAIARLLLTARGVALVLAAVAVATAVFLAPPDVSVGLRSLVAPPLLAAALIGGPEAAACAVLAVAALADVLTARGIGPFASTGEASTGLVLLQIFTAVQAVTALTVAAQASALRCANDRLTRQARQLATDPLTGVGNRSALDRALAAAAGGPAEAGAAVLYLDVDRFKAINDRYGHAAGDAILRAVAGRAAALVRRGDTLARLGGDEFAVLCPSITRDEAERLRARLKDALTTAVAVGGGSIGVSVSVGLAWHEGGGHGGLLERADIDMYKIKAHLRPAA